MTFNQARKKLKKLAKGAYRTASYVVTDIDNKQSRQECTLYIHGIDSFIGKTWQEAFDKLEEALNPSPVIIEDKNIEELK